MTPACHCVRCHNRMHIVCVRDEVAVAFICVLCDSVWQLGVGWNRWTDHFDPELLRARYA